jgi:hypothetical protein
MKKNISLISLETNLEKKNFSMKFHFLSKEKYIYFDFIFEKKNVWAKNL